MMKSYLLEIGCEELPPKAILTYKEFLKEYVNQTFRDFFIYDSPENIKIYATPRRLAILIKNLKKGKIIKNYTNWTTIQGSR
jgi:Glycyl-tRNA synthetase, beta subunit